ncbi:MAG TPA: homoserine O-acetyltransferase [Niabella sp.]|nr:homoserine O-acetyltransferase [Niabella sp.]HOZ95664.1 homoserine O-acetyltransferase [Niabella sp.]HQW13904.1 homoserine O-acetyltransferase [Niabella sp.]HQX19203.1 homoserine O-acetyltransferase [Niabella sp.]HQX41341.1 homoserine O-acetyltransferase [Niabella sp.]
MNQQVFYYSQPFTLENGAVLQNMHLAYNTYGQLNQAKNNVVWIFHALTANSQPHEWWPEMIGEGKVFDLAKDFIICVNMPGSCYGSSSPLDINPETGTPYFHDFPFFTIRDMIHAFRLLQKELGIEKIRIGIGGSTGGQQLMEWAVQDPDAFEYIFPIATNAKFSPWGKAFNASQRLAIEADSTWHEKNNDAGKKGLEVARSIALLSYRTDTAYNNTQADHNNDQIEGFRSESYQRYQGQKLSARFNAFSYYALTKTMDSHNIGRGRISVTHALSTIKAKTLALSMEGDILFPPYEQAFIASHIPNAHVKMILSDFGHDGFLLEYDQLTMAINHFLGKEATESE